MKNYKIIIQFDGGRYKGWQKVKDNELTIQEKIETVISKMATEKIEVIGCGRTDAGVHAENYVANFHTKCKLAPTAMLKYLYEFLPEDIVVKSIEEVHERFHAKLNVKSKTYVYSINIGKFRNVFNRKYTYHSEENLDIDQMKLAAESLVGTFDFQSFSSIKAGGKSSVKTINSIDIIGNDELIEIVINADDFLLHMERAIIGTLLEVGKNNIKATDIKKILKDKKRTEAGPNAQSKGLCLMDVKYSYVAKV